MNSDNQNEYPTDHSEPVHIQDAIREVLDETVDLQDQLERQAPDAEAVREQRLAERQRIDELKAKYAELNDRFVKTGDQSVHSELRTLGEQIFEAEEGLREPPTPY